MSTDHRDSRRPDHLRGHLATACGRSTRRARPRSCTPPGSPVVHAHGLQLRPLHRRTGTWPSRASSTCCRCTSMQLLIKEVLERYGDDIKPGDVFITNDPFVAGVHQSDVQFVRAVLPRRRARRLDRLHGPRDGPRRDEPRLLVPDRDRRLPGGHCASRSRGSSTQGKVNRALWDTIMANSRLPCDASPTTSRAFLVLATGSRRRGSPRPATEYGADAVAATSWSSRSSATEARMREWISRAARRRLPARRLRRPRRPRRTDLYKVNCTMTKTGDTLVFDFDGHRPGDHGDGQRRRASGTFGAVGTADARRLRLRAAVERGPDAAGRGDVPANTAVVSAEPPMPISAGSVARSWIAMRGRAPAWRRCSPSREEYADFVCGPARRLAGCSPSSAAQPVRRAVRDHVHGLAGLGRPGASPAATASTPAARWWSSAAASRTSSSTRSASRCCYLWRREAPDSGGAGRIRGGNGIEFALARLRHRGARSPPAARRAVRADLDRRLRRPTRAATARTRSSQGAGVAGAAWSAAR